MTDLQYIEQHRIKDEYNLFSDLTSAYISSLYNVIGKYKAQKKTEKDVLFINGERWVIEIHTRDNEPYELAMKY